MIPNNFFAIDDPALDGQISSFLGAVVDGETKVFGLQTDNRINLSPRGAVVPFNSLLSPKTALPISGLRYTLDLRP